MTLAPLLDAPPLIRVHAVAAMSAFLLGLTQFALPKGTPRHRALGAVWIALMLAVCLTAFGIRTLNPGHFSFVHVIA
ncbi:hypothetical protein ACI4BE_28455, partial [Klebsiella pneumoniae]|uniref:hypothetical protein n=1 Tax=Klebsiella pneumoniae TaxID=573 RepID=UPI00385543B3